MLTLIPQPEMVTYVNKMYVIKIYPIYPSVSPWILLANCMSLERIMTCLVCIAHRFVSSSNQMR